MSDTAEMVRPTASSLVAPLVLAEDLGPLASVLHVLGTKSRLETVQLLMHGPRLSTELPARLDELHMLREIGILTSERVSTGTRTLRWTLRLDALERVAACLAG